MALQVRENTYVRGNAFRVAFQDSIRLQPCGITGFGPRDVTVAMLARITDVERCQIQFSQPFHGMLTTLQCNSGKASFSAVGSPRCFSHSGRRLECAFAWLVAARKVVAVLCRRKRNPISRSSETLRYRANECPNQTPSQHHSAESRPIAMPKLTCLSLHEQRSSHTR
jgi:hypothetical protein